MASDRGVCSIVVESTGGPPRWVAVEEASAIAVSKSKVFVCAGDSVRVLPDWTLLARVPGDCSALTVDDRNDLVVYVGSPTVRSMDIERDKVVDERLAVNAIAKDLAFDAARGELLIVTETGHLEASAPRVLGAARPVPRTIRSPPLNAIASLGRVVVAASDDRLLLARIPGPREGSDLRILATAHVGTVSSLALVNETTVAALVNNSLTTFRISSSRLHLLSVLPLCDHRASDDSALPSDSVDLVLSSPRYPQHQQQRHGVVVLFLAFVFAMAFGLRRCCRRRS